MVVQENFGSYQPTDESFGTFLYNRRNGTVLGRTGSSWGKIGAFYLVFYSFLAGFFAIMMTIFYQTLDTQTRPTYTPGPSGGILQNPALGYRPLPPKDNIESSLVWFNSTDNKTTDHWITSLNNFFEAYSPAKKVENITYIPCDESVELKENEVCEFKAEWLKSRCSSELNWGYKSKSPCVVLKLNRMINWVPEVYETVSELPKEMPEDLKEYISNSRTNADGTIPKTIWISCVGKYPTDEEYIGKLNYEPWRGFPAYFFPYTNTPGYLAPVISLEFENPRPNVVINIECKAWAKNIVHDRSRRFGLIQFEILVD